MDPGKLNYEILASSLRRSVVDTKAWIQGGLFKPYFDDLLDNYIKPKAEKAFKEGERRNPGPTFPAVQRELHEIFEG